MADEIKLQTNYGTVSGTDNFHISFLLLDIKGLKIQIGLEGNVIDTNGKDNWNGFTKMIEYSGEQAKTFLTTLNTKNFSTTSMKKTILNKLVVDGYLSGEVM